MKKYIYPFTAIVGQGRMKTALILNAVDSSIGGVLISGHKGTGKSTAVRALANLLPDINVVKGCPYHCDPRFPEKMHDECREKLERGENLETELRPMPLVELPLGATEDRVTGTLHVEHALKTGERRFEPGLLAAANNGILYVDEVNLLEDHLVDLLLDAAASGFNVVEREGISVVHPARLMLIGTMNPEEGVLRPQFLDRFGLYVDVHGLNDMNQRKSVIRRRMEYEKDPSAFISRWKDRDKRLALSILNARNRLESVKVPDEMVEIAVRISMDVEARGHRADIAVIKTAAALAALSGKDQAGEKEIARAASLALPHRMKTSPLHSPEISHDAIEESLARITGKKKRLNQKNSSRIRA